MGEVSVQHDPWLRDVGQCGCEVCRTCAWLNSLCMVVFICVAWTDLRPSPAHRFGHLGHFYMRSGHQVFLEESLIWGPVGIPFFSLVFLPSAAGDGEIAGIGAIPIAPCWAPHAAAAALGIAGWRKRTREPERQRKGLGAGGWGGDGQSRNFHEVPNLFHKRRL